MACYMCVRHNLKDAGEECYRDCAFMVGGTCKYGEFECGEDSPQCDIWECGCVGVSPDDLVEAPEDNSK